VEHTVYYGEEDLEKVMRSHTVIILVKLVNPEVLEEVCHKEEEQEKQ